MLMFSAHAGNFFLHGCSAWSKQQQRKREGAVAAAHAAQLLSAGLDRCPLVSLRCPAPPQAQDRTLVARRMKEHVHSAGKVVAGPLACSGCPPAAWPCASPPSPCSAAACAPPPPPPCRFHPAAYLPRGHLRQQRVLRHVQARRLRPGCVARGSGSGFLPGCVGATSNTAWCSSAAPFDLGALWGDAFDHKLDLMAALDRSMLAPAGGPTLSVVHPAPGALRPTPERPAQVGSSIH